MVLMMGVLVLSLFPASLEAATPDSAEPESRPTRTGETQRSASTTGTPITALARMGAGFPSFLGATVGADIGRLALRLGMGRGAYQPATLTGKIGYRAPIVRGRGSSGRGWTFGIPILAGVRGLMMDGGVDGLAVGPELELDLRYWFNERIGLTASGAIGAALTFRRWGMTTYGGGGGGGGRESLRLAPPIPTGSFEIGVVF